MTLREYAGLGFVDMVEKVEAVEGCLSVEVGFLVRFGKGGGGTGDTDLMFLEFLGRCRIPSVTVTFISFIVSFMIWILIGIWYVILPLFCTCTPSTDSSFRCPRYPGPHIEGFRALYGRHAVTNGTENNDGRVWPSSTT